MVDLPSCAVQNRMRKTCVDIVNVSRRTVIVRVFQGFLFLDDQVITIRARRVCVELDLETFDQRKICVCTVLVFS
jgi:hypothetical protein